MKDVVPGKLFALALASIALVGPLAVHLFLPVIPAVKAAFGVSEAVTQLTFSVALFAMAFATLVYGSLADRYGRRPVLLSGLTLILLGSVVSALASSVPMLVLGRFVQAVGAGSGMTLVRTIARDAYGPERVVKAIAYLTMFYTLGPMLAPVIGGALVDTVGWRSVFALALIMGAAILIGAYAAIFETRPQSARGRAEIGIFRSYVALFSHLRFTAFVLQSGFTSGAFMTMASASSVLMREFLQRPSTEYGVYFMLFPIGYFTGNFIASRVGNRAAAEAMVLAGAIVSMAAVATLAVLLLSGRVSPLAIFLPGCFLTMGQGISLAYAQAGAMATIPQVAGTAAGIGVFLQFFGGALFAQAYGLIANGRPGPMVLTATIATVLGLVAGAVPFAIMRRRRGG
jgi:DHA1 family bicyclomycin/chloramphenicol resistance-like MFS transporter